MTLTAQQQSDWDRDGFFILPGFFEQAALDEMLDAVAALARSIAAGNERPDLFVAHEKAIESDTPEGSLSKIFRVMRTEPVFNAIATDPRLLGLVGALVGPNVDCFLSQFIFKHPGALGQPWHQDNYYFRLDPRPQVGVWIACTAATMDNGPLWVVPGSHREKIHDVVPDSRPAANLGYVEIVDAAVDDERVVLMDPGDVLIFDSHLRHKSTDNNSDDSRAAMVYHYGDAASVGHRAFNQDWTEVLRNGQPVTASTAPQPIVH